MKLLSIILLAGGSVNGGPGDEPKTKCQSCEQLASGILALMEKTKKANFGGGNTRWEEKSLGKWAISETRLLEITENACGGGYGSINLQRYTTRAQGRLQVQTLGSSILHFPILVWILREPRPAPVAITS